MKNKKIAWAMLPALLAMLLAACGSPKSTETGTDTGTDTETGTETETETGGTQTETSEVITHRPGYVKGSPEGAVTRKFDEEFDTLLDDFSGATINGQTTGTLHDGYLTAVVDSEDQNFPTADNKGDKSIYKMGAPTFEPAASVTFKMRVVEGKLPLKNLVFALRGTDDLPLYEINMAEAYDEEGEPLPELTNEFQDLTVSLAYSLEDPDATYGDSNIKVAETHAAFHLYAVKEEVSAVVEIKQISRKTTAGVSNVIDSFARKDIGEGQNDIGAWWQNSAPGYIARKGVALEKGASYQTRALDEEEREQTNLVLDINGDTSNTSIVPVKGSVEGTAVKWENLKTKDDTAVVNATSGAYTALAIDLEKSGLAGNDVTAYKVVSTSHVEIDNVFLTSFGVPEEAPVAPRLDAESKVLIDDFNREADPVPTVFEDGADSDAGITGMVTYGATPEIKAATAMKNGYLSMPATSDYAELTVGTSRAYENNKYLVFEMNLSADKLNDFRFSFDADGKTTYLNQGVAAKNLTSFVASTMYPAINEGYSLYVVDVALSGFKMGYALNMYYTGSEELRINEVFTCNALDEMMVVAEGVVEVNNLDLANYARIGYAEPVFSRYLRLTLTGTGANADAIRINLGGVSKWMHDGKLVATINGEAVTAETALSGKVVIVYDLLASEFEINGGTLSVEAGGGQQGTIALSSIELLEPGYAEKFYIADADSVSLTVADDGYKYGGWVYIPHGTEATVLKLHAKGDGKVTYGPLRFALDVERGIANKGIIAKRANGEVIDGAELVPTAGEDIYLAKADGTPFMVGFHSHYGDPSIAGGTLVLSDFYAICEHTPLDVIINAFKA